MAAYLAILYCKPHSGGAKAELPLSTLKLIVQMSGGSAHVQVDPGCPTKAIKVMAGAVQGFREWTKLSVEGGATMYTKIQTSFPHH